MDVRYENPLTPAYYSSIPRRIRKTSNFELYLSVQLWTCSASAFKRLSSC